MNQNIRRTSNRLSWMMIIYFTAVSFSSYNSVYLQSIGYDASSVGTISALLSLIGFVSTPLFGILSDKTKQYTKIIRVLLIISMLSNLLVIFFNGYYLLGINLSVIILMISAVFKTPVGALIENYCISVCNDKKINYGKFRSFGSLSFAIMCVILGIIIPKIGIMMIFPALSLVYLLVLFFVKNDGKQQPSNKKFKPSALLKNKKFISCILFTAVIAVSTQCNFTFLPYLLESIDVDTGKVGIIIGYSGLLECPILAGFQYLSKKTTLKNAYILSGLLYAVASMCYVLGKSFTFILFVASTIAGVAHGLYVVAGNNYVYQITDEDTKATAMTIYTSMASISGMIGNIVGGKIIFNSTVQTFFLIVAIASVVSCVLFYISREK